MFKTRGELLYAKVETFSSSRVQIKDCGLTYGIDEETSPFLALKVSFWVQVVSFRGIMKLRQHAHKSPVGVKFKFSKEHSLRLFHMEAPPPGFPNV